MDVRGDVKGYTETADRWFDRAGVPSRDTRRSPRVAGLVLVEPERLAVREADRKVYRCGRRWCEVQRVSVVGERVNEHRRLMRLTCGHRTCGWCQRRALRQRSERLRGAWTSILTTTYNRSYVSARDAWARVTDDAQWLARTLVEAHERQTGDRPHFAWVVEEHRSGWPHIHLVGAWSCDLMDSWLLRLLWTERVGAHSWVVDWQAVKDQEGARSYLRKYLCKGAMRRDVAAVLGGRRIFGRSQVADWEDEETEELPASELWQAIRPVSHGAAVDLFAAAERDPSALPGGWSVDRVDQGTVLDRSRALSRPELMRMRSEMEAALAALEIGVAANPLALAPAPAFRLMRLLWALDTGDYGKAQRGPSVCQPGREIGVDADAHRVNEKPPAPVVSAGGCLGLIE